MGKLGKYLDKIKTWINNLSVKAFVIAGAAILGLTIILLVVAMLPGNVSKRAVNKGDNLFLKGDFEKAAIMYDKAVSKNRLNLAGYAGSVLAKSNYDIENARDALLQAVDITKDAAEDTKKTNELIEIYLLAPSLFTDDAKKLNEVLQYGYDMLSEPGELRPALFDSYVALGDCSKKESPLVALEQYDKAALLEPDNAELNDKIGQTAGELIVKYIESDQYEAAYATLDKYGLVYGLDVDSLKNEINSAQELYEVKISLLSKVYEKMKFYYDLVGKDFNEEQISDESNVLCGMLSVGWADMLELDGSQEAEQLATSLSQSAYIYVPDANEPMTGLGCGLYTYGEPSEDAEGNLHVKYYFFFGEYENGVRNGYGFSFAESKEDSYRGFEGSWKNDAPEGFGVEYISNYQSKLAETQYQRITYGNYASGIENGTMTTRIRLTDASEEMFIGTYEVTDGDANEVPTTTDDYELLNEIPENQKVIAVIPSVNKGYDIHNVLYQLVGSRLAVLGYN